MSEPIAPRETHAATAAVCDLLRCIAELGGATTAALAAATNVHRDTTRRVLVELEAQGWVYQVELRNIRGSSASPETHWHLAAGLQQLALGWMEQQLERITTLQAEVQRASQPHAWRTVDGQRRWLPVDDGGGQQ
jgi:predicted ArsR family transcriptional regulator